MAKTPAAIDGISLLPTLLGTGEQTQHDYLFWIHTRGAAIRMGNWKYIYGTDALYDDLATDIREENNVAAKHPKVMRKFESIMATNHDPTLFRGVKNTIKAIRKNK